ncbi:2'-5' RNA ligase [Granulibacter bethesdensis]|uniref:RNA 2',3'-cyclic phosphodiesterase n=2 Tax=Granulibacter bethesdensis TaxID=364410 RepID=A0AAC9K6I6_9PROT|nr:2'-5' RNA ligase [Granulibacter bethesdensis]APH61183.1 2'-5' RNA ligase [Granulibacter bethesdensis]
MTMADITGHRTALLWSCQPDCLAHAAPATPSPGRAPMRLFVGLDLPWILKDELYGIAYGLPGARWISPENYHLTLRFIGDVPGHRADELDLALSSLRARGFSLVLTGIGIFERAGRSTLYVGVEKNPQLDHLQNKIETALQRVGLPAERRRFMPHVTLARLDGTAENRLASYVQSHNLFRTDPIPVEHFTLFSSQLGKEQSVYTVEADYALA